MKILRISIYFVGFVVHTLFIIFRNEMEIVFWLRWFHISNSTNTQYARTHEATSKCSIYSLRRLYLDERKSFVLNEWKYEA